MITDTSYAVVRASNYGVPDPDARCKVSVVGVTGSATYGNNVRVTMSDLCDIASLSLTYDEAMELSARLFEAAVSIAPR